MPFDGKVSDYFETKPVPVYGQWALQEILKYDPETGKLFWKERPVHYFAEGNQTAAINCAKWNKQYAGKEAFTAIHHGYRVGRVLGKYARAHRVIWLLVTGVEPDTIDHINGARSDNRWVNLRSVSGSENARNMRRLASNTSGVTGVYFNKPVKKWQAYITANGAIQYLGLFDRIEDAAEARKAAEERYGYHPNHGKPPVPEYTKENPPPTMAEAIRMAVADVEAQERAGIQYDWYDCEACTAGAVCRRLGRSWGSFSGKWEGILDILSDITFGSKDENLREIAGAGTDWTRAGFGAVPDITFSLTPYAENPTAFKRDMLALADRLEGEGV